MTSDPHPSQRRSSSTPRPPRAAPRPWGRFPSALCVGAALAFTPAAAFAQLPDGALTQDGYVLPSERVQELFATDKNFATLDQINPAGTHFFVPHVTELTTLERMAEPTLRLGMLELRPQADRPWHLDHYGIDGLRLFDLEAREFMDVELPDDVFISDLTWSPDGATIGFLTHFRDRTEVWSARALDGSARRLDRGNDHVITSIGSGSRGQGSQPSRMLQWTPDGSVVTLVEPEGRGTPPVRGSVPEGPVIRRTRDDATPNPTYPYLLREPYDAERFEYYTTSQIAVVRPGQRPRRVGDPGMYEEIRLSPDGRHLLTTRIVRPFSYISSWNGFPRVTEVLDLQTGEVLATLEEQPLQEARRRGGGAGDAPRLWAWRPDGQGLSYVRRAPARADEEEAARDPDERGDRVFFLPPPFDTAMAGMIAYSPDRVRSLTYTRNGGRLFAEVDRDGDRALVHWDLSGGDYEEVPQTVTLPRRRTLVEPWDPDDALELPGSLWTTHTGNGVEFARLTEDGTATWLRGSGYSADLRPRPFVDRVSLADATTERVFEGAATSFDQPLVLLPGDGTDAHIVVSREAVHDFPDSFLWDGRSFENLTNNVDPFPDITAARRIDFEFERRDGLKVKGRVSLPVDYVEGTQVPAIFWTYPREYRSEEAFEQATYRSRNLNAHSQLSWLRWSDIWLTQGYALIYPDIPIVGENYNDFYIANMVDGMYGAVRAVEELGVVDIDRIGHGGHSYGAFATANFLAHTPFFKAGIAGDGAYNRTLTPQGFQAEPRNIWEAPHVYLEMSPFFKADQINTPLLMYHGADDNNTGTYPIQSERFMQALQGLGKEAVLYMYPFESHTPRAIENKLDMWARFIAWFDHYVKGADTQELVGGTP